MTTLEVTFQKNYHTSLEDRFLMETLIIRVMGDIAGEDAQILWDKARTEAESNHRRHNPHLFPVNIQEATNQLNEKRRMNEIAKQPLADQIKSCTDLKVLESYKFIVKGKPDLEEIYQSKLKELS